VVIKIWFNIWTILATNSNSNCGSFNEFVVPICVVDWDWGVVGVLLEEEIASKLTIEPKRRERVRKTSNGSSKRQTCL